MQLAKPLIEIFKDPNYAWELLDSEINLQTKENITGEDISYLLQLYMRGVERMNSMIDSRESFFKNRVTALMSRPNVIRILNKPMTKKNKPDQAEATEAKKLDSKVERHLKQKRKEIEMRMAYGAEQHNPDALKKMMAEQNQKETFLTTKIQKIVDSHEERLLKRIKQRKMRTLTAKSRSDIFVNQNGNSNLNGAQKKQMMQKNRDEEQFGFEAIMEELENGGKKKRGDRREHKSLPSSSFRPKQQQQFESPGRARRISIDVIYQLKPDKGQKKW